MSNLVWRMVRRRTTDRKRFSSFHYSIFWKDLHCKRKKFGEKVLPLSVKRVSAAAKRSGYRLPLRKAAEKDPATGICGCTKMPGGRGAAKERGCCLKNAAPAIPVFFAGVCLAVLQIQHSALKVRVLGVVDFDDAFVGSSYHGEYHLSCLK